MSLRPEPPPASDPGPAPWTGAPFGQPYPPQVGRDDSGSPGDRLVFTLASILGGVAVGFAGGGAWAAVADPPLALYTRRGVYFNSEVSYDHRVALTLWFLLVGLAGGLLAGLLIGWLGRRRGVVTVIASLAMSATASGIAAWSGIHVFGPSVSAQLDDASFGDMVRTALTITSDVAYLGWPIGAVTGVLLVVGLTPNDRSPDRNGPEPPSPSGTVVAH